MTKPARILTTLMCATMLMLVALVSLASASVPAQSRLAPQASIDLSLQPANQSVAAGQVFTVALIIADVTDLASFDFYLMFDPAVVTATNWTLNTTLLPGWEGLPVDGMTYRGSNQAYLGADNNGGGAGSFNGNGTLETITFQALATGNSNLNIVDPTLYGGPPDFEPLPDPVNVTNATASVYRNIYTWTGSTSSAWNTVENWLSGVVPTSFDDAVIPGTGVTNWPSVDSLTAVYNLTVQSGAALTITGNAVLNVEGAVVNNGALTEIKSVPSGSTTEFLHLRNAAGTSDPYHGVDITPAADMDLTAVTITGNQPKCTSNLGDALLMRCFNITPGTAVTATLRFWYTEAERNNQTANDLKLWHYAPWAQVGTSYTYSEGDATCSSGGGVACWLQVDDVANYSPFGVGSGSAPTAISLRTLTARVESMAWLPIGLIMSGAVVVIALRKRHKQV
jgi:hypothetical protein